MKYSAQKMIIGKCGPQATGTLEDLDSLKGLFRTQGLRLEEPQLVGPLRQLPRGPVVRDL